jgi:hypothetical protein
MLELSPEQRQAVRESHGDSVRLTDPDTEQEYVLVRAETYERLESLLGNDSDWTAEERLQLLAESGRRAGWDAPEMDVYENYDENRKKLCR